jgi:hypothetical protein
MRCNQHPLKKKVNVIHAQNFHSDPRKTWTSSNKDADVFQEKKPLDLSIKHVDEKPCNPPT